LYGFALRRKRGSQKSWKDALRIIWAIPNRMGRRNTRTHLNSSSKRLLLALPVPSFLGLQIPPEKIKFNARNFLQKSEISSEFGAKKTQKKNPRVILIRNICMCFATRNEHQSLPGIQTRKFKKVFCYKKNFFFLKNLYNNELLKIYTMSLKV
jgi:hypothetical protein